jgi:enoyl-CoA hydratase/carnithine racemase
LDPNITRRWIDAQDALAIGLVAEVVAAAKLESRALELAQRLARLPRENAAIAKLAVWGGLGLPLDDGPSLERRLAYRLERLSGEGHHHHRRSGQLKRRRRPRAARG